MSSWAYSFIYIYIYIYIYREKSIWRCPYICIYTCIYIYAFMHIHIHSYKHICHIILLYISELQNHNPYELCIWGYRIHRLHLCRGIRSHPQCPGYDTKQSDGEVPALLELWGMWSTPLLPLIQGSLWGGMIASDRALSMGYIELTAYIC